MIIGVDVDGVIADLHHSWLARYNEEYSDDLTVSRIHQWDMLPAVKPECGKKIYSYLSNLDLYDTMPQMLGAFAGINHLRKMGHLIRFITSSARGQGDQKVEWLVRNGFTNEHADDVFMLYGKETDKSVVFADVLIDDYHMNFRNWVNDAILVHAPYNASATGTWTRAHGWDEIVEAVISLS